MNADIMAKLIDMENNYKMLFKRYEEQMTINKELKRELHEIRQQLNDKEQQELNNNVVIQGIHVKENENAQVLVDKIANTLKVTAKVKKAYRLHGPQNGKAYPPVKVVFENQDDKKQCMDDS